MSDKPPCQCSDCKLTRRFAPFVGDLKLNNPELYDAIDDLWGNYLNMGLDYNVLQAKLDGSWPDYWQYSKRLELLHKFAPPKDLKDEYE